MGDRISFQFVNGEDKSVAFFSHRDGRRLLATVKEFLNELNALPINEKISTPLSRGEPNTIMAHFVAWFFTKGDLTLNEDGNYYLGNDENDGDNSDNGNYLFDLRPNKNYEEEDPDSLNENESYDD